MLAEKKNVRKTPSTKKIVKNSSTKFSGKSTTKLKNVKSTDEEPAITNGVSESLKELQPLESKLRIKIEDVSKAIEGLVHFRSTNPKLKNQLFSDFPILLSINCFKVAKNQSRILRIPLKYPLANDSESSSCLIVAEVKGVPNKEHEKHVQHYEDLLRQKGVTNISKIMTFHELRTEYETFEMKQKLVLLYDVFLADAKICGKVVKNCGKIFYKKRKVPVPVKLQVTKLKEHIDKALSKTALHLHSNGDSYSVQFGQSNMKVSEMVHNFYNVLEALDKEFPGGFENIYSLNIFTHRGLTLPIYLSLKNAKDIPVPEIERGPILTPVIGELTTQMNSKVIVKPTGQVIVKHMEEGEDLEAQEKAMLSKIMKNQNKKRKFDEVEQKDDPDKPEMKKPKSVENGKTQIKSQDEDIVPKKGAKQSKLKAKSSTTLKNQNKKRGIDKDEPKNVINKPQSKKLKSVEDQKTQIENQKEKITAEKSERKEIKNDTSDINKNSSKGKKGQPIPKVIVSPDVSETKRSERITKRRTSLHKIPSGDIIVEEFRPIQLSKS